MPTDDELSPEQRIGAGFAAQSVLESEAFRAAVLQAEGSIIEQWKHTDDTPTREQLHAKLMGLYAVVRELRVTMDDGRLAVAERERQERPT